MTIINLGKLEEKIKKANDQWDLFTKWLKKKRKRRKMVKKLKKAFQNFPRNGFPTTGKFMMKGVHINKNGYIVKNKPSLSYDSYVATRKAMRALKEVL